MTTETPGMGDPCCLLPYLVMVMSFFRNGQDGMRGGVGGVSTCLSGYCDDNIISHLLVLKGRMKKQHVQGLLHRPRPGGQVREWRYPPGLLVVGKGKSVCSGSFFNALISGSFLYSKLQFSLAQVLAAGVSGKQYVDSAIIIAWKTNSIS